MEELKNEEENSENNDSEKIEIPKPKYELEYFKDQKTIIKKLKEVRKIINTKNKELNLKAERLKNENFNYNKQLEWMVLNTENLKQSIQVKIDEKLSNFDIPKINNVKQYEFLNKKQKIKFIKHNDEVINKMTKMFELELNQYSNNANHNNYNLNNYLRLTENDRGRINIKLKEQIISLNNHDFFEQYKNPFNLEKSPQTEFKEIKTVENIYDEIMLSTLSDYSVKKIPGNGECFYQALLEVYSNKNCIINPESQINNTSYIRNIVSDYVKYSDLIDENQIKFQSESIEINSQEEYAEMIKSPGFYGGEIEAYVLTSKFNIWFATYSILNTNNSGTWHIIGDVRVKPDEIIFLKLTYFRQDSNSTASHYDLLIKNERVPKIDWQVPTK